MRCFDRLDRSGGRAARRAVTCGARRAATTRVTPAARTRGRAFDLTRMDVRTAGGRAIEIRGLPIVCPGGFGRSRMDACLARPSVRRDGAARDKMVTWVPCVGAGTTARKTTEEGDEGCARFCLGGFHFDGENVMPLFPPVQEMRLANCQLFTFFSQYFSIITNFNASIIFF